MGTGIFGSRRAWRALAIGVAFAVEAFGLGPEAFAQRRLLPPPGASAAAQRPEGARLIAQRARALANARDRIARLGAAVRGARMRRTGSFHNGVYASVRGAEIVETGEAVVLRSPPQISQAVRLHNTMVQLAHEIGVPDLVPPSTEASVPDLDDPGSNRTAMVAEHVGRRFLPANQAPAEWLSRVPEEQRVAGAVLDFLTDQQDRIPKNLMIDERGNVRLIDHDFSLGHNNPFDNHRSMFWPRRSLAFTSRQERARDLPPAIRATVVTMARATPAAIAERYGVTEREARVMLGRANLIARYGLSAATGRAEEVKTRIAQRTLRGRMPPQSRSAVSSIGGLERPIALAAAADLRRAFGEPTPSLADVADDAARIERGELSEVVSERVTSPAFEAMRRGTSTENVLRHVIASIHRRAPREGELIALSDLVRDGDLLSSVQRMIKGDEYRQRVAPAARHPLDD